MTTDSRFRQLEQLLLHSGREDLAKLLRSRREDGGPGSGNWGHAGRKGMRGGSAPGESTGIFKGVDLGGYSPHISETERKALTDPETAKKYLAARGMDPEKVSGLGDGLFAEARKAIVRKYEETAQRYRDCPPEQQRFMNMPAEEARAFVRKCVKAELPEGLNEESDTQRVIHALGVNGKPKFARGENFQRLQENSPLLYRGVVGNQAMGLEADDIVDITLSDDDCYIGGGVFGDGIYFSTRKRTAQNYASEYMQSGAVFPDACLNSSARVAPFQELEEDSEEPWDYSIDALRRGYNVIQVHKSAEEDYYVVLDRTALTFRT